LASLRADPTKHNHCSSWGPPSLPNASFPFLSIKIVKSSTVVSPLRMNTSLFGVLPWGLITTALIPSPLTETPAGIVKGKTSLYVPGYM